MLEQYIKEELIFLKQSVIDRAELFQQLSDIYMEKGYVGEGFHAFLSERENNYPTGLELESYTVAIPHGDPEHIKESFISVVTLERPIKMSKMEDSDVEIDVDLFFVLGLADGTQHLEILRKIVGLIQQKAFVTKLKQAASPHEVLAEIIEASK